MSIHRAAVAELMRKAVYAVTDNPLYGEGANMAATIFETMLEDWYGLEIVSHNGLVAEGDMYGPLKVVRIDEKGKIHLPDVKLPLSPKRAHQLGVALIGAAHLSRDDKRRRRPERD